MKCEYCVKLNFTYLLNAGLSQGYLCASYVFNVCHLSVAWTKVVYCFCIFLLNFEVLAIFNIGSFPRLCSLIKPSPKLTL